MRTAVAAYERARGVVELVQGLGAADQGEIDSNRVAVNLNLAAAHLALKASKGVGVLGGQAGREVGRVGQRARHPADLPTEATGELRAGIHVPCATPRPWQRYPKLHHVPTKPPRPAKPP
jgi:hypothetical protein